MSTMRMHLLNSRTVRLNGLGTFTMKARTRGKGTEKAEDVNLNQVTALRCQFTLEYTRARRLLVLLALCCRAWNLKNGWKQPLKDGTPAVCERMAERKKIRWDEKSYDLSSNNFGNLGTMSIKVSVWDTSVTIAVASTLLQVSADKQ